jgi:DNA polymerase III psi subunit
MGLEKIQLPAAVIADMYRNSLVLLQDVQEKPAALATVSMPETGLKTLGENRQKTVILVRDATALHLADAELDLLIKILQAVQLSMADVLLANLQAQKTNAAFLQANYAAQKVLLFGVPLHDLEMPIVFPHFQVQQHGGVRYLSAPSLAQLQSDVNAKKQLWVSIKKMFDV